MWGRTKLILRNGLVTALLLYPKKMQKLPKNMYKLVKKNKQYKWLQAFD
ncbi:MAG: hypothetical protein K0Q99_1302 [Clostridia bacterium]|jgi:hypothetical protein|nr:hypothetical protein [Clostridia bacterium]